MTNLDLKSVAVQAPPTPSKWDIIPIHTSDRASFKFCRRQWAWSSPSRDNLVPKAMVHGVREPLWFGTGIHYALQKYYSPLREDPEVAFTKWFHLQWNGGLITEDEIKEYVDRNPVFVKQEPLTQSDADGRVVWEGHPPAIYRVDGLKDILPFPDEEKFLGLLDLGQGMMRFYKDYSEREDNFAVIALEHEFSVPILGPNGEPLYMYDHRKMPEGWQPTDTQNNYGYLNLVDDDPIVCKKQVHARGRMDVIVQDQTSGQFGVRDYKTTSRLDDDYFRHLDLDEQCTSYLTLGEIEAKTYGLEYSSLDYIDYVALLKAYPKPPTPLKSGLPSLNRQTESTTALMFEQYIKDNGLEPIFKIDEKMQAYYSWLVEMGEKMFIHVKPVRRNKMQKTNAMIRLYYEAIDMLSDPRLYPNPTKNYGCLNCIFRAPCIAVESGADYKSMLEDGYVPNWDR